MSVYRTDIPPTILANGVSPTPDAVPTPTRPAWWLWLWRSKSAWAVFLWAVFLTSRALLFVVLSIWQPRPDTDLYARYAHFHRLAVAQGTNLYAFNDSWVQWKRELALRGGYRPMAEETRFVEYPPLSLVAVILPGLLMEPHEELELPPSWLVSYTRLYRLEMILWDLLAYVVLLWLVPRWYPDEKPWQHAERLLVYNFSSCILGYLLYDRLDLPMGVMILVAAALLVEARYWLGSYIVLSAAVAFKLVPLILLPAWVLLSLPLTCWQSGGWVNWIRVALGRSLILGILVVAWFLPAYLLGGSLSMGFLQYHRNRGLEIESTYASLLMLGGLFGHPIKVYFSHGSYNLASSWEIPLARVSLPLTAVALLGVILFQARACWRQARFLAPARSGQSLAARVPELVVFAILLQLITFIIMGKVFSPQYMLWLVPIIPLVAGGNPNRSLTIWPFFGVCLLTTIIIPFIFRIHIIGWPFHAPEHVLYGPSAIGAISLAARNGALGLLGGYLYFQMARTGRVRQS